MMHKWWARRLGPVFRMLLLGATNSSEKSEWIKNGAFFEKHDLSRIKLFDPFVGGGTSVVEASKCGASVIGADIDPVAAFVTSKELAPIDESLLQAAFKEIKDAAKNYIQQWYRTTLPDGRKGTIIYAFWVEEIFSPKTGKAVLVHPHYQLRRDLKNKRQIVFCAKCHSIEDLSLSRRNFNCQNCGHHTTISEGIIKRGRINAAGFKPNQRLHELYSREEPPFYRLFALQVLVDDTHEKVFKKVDDADLALFARAEIEWEQEIVRRVEGLFALADQQELRPTMCSGFISAYGTPLGLMTMTPRSRSTALALPHV